MSGSKNVFFKYQVDDILKNIIFLQNIERLIYCIDLDIP